MKEYKVLDSIRVFPVTEVRTMGGPEEWLYRVSVEWRIKHCQTDATSFAREDTLSGSGVGKFIAEALLEVI